MMSSLEEKVERLVASLRRLGKGTFSKEELDGEMVRTLGLWRSEQRAAFRRALEELGVVAQAGEWYVWGERAGDFLRCVGDRPQGQEPDVSPPRPRGSGRPKFVAWLVDTVRAKGRTTVPELLREALLEGRWGIHTNQLDYYLDTLEKGGLIRRRGEEVVWSGA